MMYPYMTLSDETNIVHSQMHDDGTVKVYIERPRDGGFDHAACILPQYDWREVSGFTSEEMAFFDKFVHDHGCGMMTASKTA